MLGAVVAWGTSRLRKPPPAAGTLRANALLVCSLAWVVTGPTWPGQFCASFGLALLASAGLAARRSARRRGRLWYGRPDLAMYQTP